MNAPIDSIGPRLKGRRAIVTGAGSGIGRAIAGRFIAEGARVLIADIDTQAAQSASDELGEGAACTQVDVAVGESMRNLMAEADRIWGGLDIMVNNAGIGLKGTVESTAEADWDRILDVTLKGTFLGLKHALPLLRKSRGSAINICSIAALAGIPDRAAYSAAKGGILSLTRAAAIDHIGEGIRINCIVPGTVETPWIDRITAEYPDPEAARAAMRARQPHARFVQPEEIAAMAAFLASDQAGSIVGAAMVIDGGMTAR